MTLSLKDFELRHPGRAKPVPHEYSGQWIAWSADRNRIVAHGEDVIQVRAAAAAAGHTNSVLQKVPRGPFVGGV
jgi:hypothetical protein